MEPRHARAHQAAFALVWLALDQATKAWVESASFAPRELVPGWLGLVRAHNTGIAFSLLADVPTSALVVIALGVAGFLVRAWWKAENALEQWAIAAILAGAAGNLLDRLRLGYVVDFIDAHWGPHHWPAFNLADTAITLGAVALVLQGLLARR